MMLGAGATADAWRDRMNQLAAESRQLATDSASVRVKDPNLRAQMALLATSLSPTREARSALLDVGAVDVPTRWLGHGSAVIAATPDGEIVVRGDGAGRITIWRATDLTTSPGRTVTVDPDGGPIYGLSLTRVGTTVVLAVGGRSVSALWDVTDTPRQFADVKAPGPVYSTAISASGLVAAFGGEIQTTVVALDGATTRVAEIPGTSRAVALTRDGTLFVGGKASVSVYTRGATGYVNGPPLTDAGARNSPRAQTLTVSADGRVLAAGYNAPRVALWDLTTMTPLPALTVGVDWVNGVTFSPDGAGLAVASSDEHTYVYDTRTWMQTRMLSDPSKVTSAAWSGARLVTAGVDGAARIWPEQSPLARTGGTSIWQFASDLNGKRWLAASTGGVVLLWRVDGIRLVPMPPANVPAGFSTTTAVAISPDGSLMTAGTRSGHVITWELGPDGAGAPRTDRLFDAGTIGSVSYSASSTDLAATRYLESSTALARRQPDGSWQTVSVIDTPTPQVVSFGVQRPLLWVGLGANEVQTWDVSDLAKPALLSSITTDATPSVQVPGPGRLLAVGADSGTVTVWDTADPARPVLMRTFTSALSAVYGVAFDPEGTTLVGASSDGLLWGWDLATGAVSFALDGRLGRAQETRFVADGALLVGTGDAGAVRTWRLDTAAIREDLCSRLGDRLTPAEITRYLPGITVSNPCPG